MRRLALLLVAVAASAAGVLVGPAEADAEPPETSSVSWPACEGVLLAGGRLRLFVDPGTVVAGTVVQVRSRRHELAVRRDGVWVGNVRPLPGVGRDVHVVIKSDAARFSERRWSGWLHCRTVKP